jgi:hypothetical protein
MQPSITLGLVMAHDGIDDGDGDVHRPTLAALPRALQAIAKIQKAWGITKH